MFWAIKPELLRLSKRQHLADDYKKKGNRANLGPQCIGKPRNGKKQVRESPDAMLPLEIADDGAVLS